LNPKRLLGLWALYIALGSSFAEAALVFTLERVNASTAILSATGTLDFTLAPGLNQVEISLLGATSVSADTGTDGNAAGFTLGGVAVDLVRVPFNTSNFVIRFPQLLPDGSTPSGSATIILLNETWMPVGVTGNVTADIEFQPGTVVGSYSIVAANNEVPEPSTIGMMGVGVAGLLALIQRRRR
jgi:hypothetical protein